jgi:hypothetical protein
LRDKFVGLNAADFHIMAMFIASTVACEIIELLPETDLIAELKIILETQYDLFCHFVDNKHFGTERIEDFIEYADETQKNIIQLRESE